VTGPGGLKAPEIVARPPRASPPASTPVPYGEIPGKSKPLSKLKLALAGVLAFLVILAGITLGAPALSRSAAGPIDLRVRDAGGQLILEWDRYATAVQAAVSGSLEVSDGGDVYRISLTPDELHGGRLVYERQSGNVELALRVRDPGGGTISEFTHYVGAEPLRATQDPMNDELNRSMREERDRLRQRLESEVDQLEALQKAVDEVKVNLGM